MWLLGRCGFLRRCVLVSSAGSLCSALVVLLVFLTSLLLRMHVVVGDARGFASCTSFVAGCRFICRFAWSRSDVCAGLRGI